MIFALSSSLRDVGDENLNSLVQSIRSENDPYLCPVKVGKRNVIIAAGQTKKITCRINAGFVDQGTPVIFKSNATDSLPKGIEIEEYLLHMRSGNCVKLMLLFQIQACMMLF